MMFPPTPLDLRLFRNEAENPVNLVARDVIGGEKDRLRRRGHA